MSFAFTRSRWSSPSCDVVSLQSLAIILCLRNKMFRAISSRVSHLGSGNLTRTCASPSCIQTGTPASGLSTASPRAVSSHLSLLHESITSTTQVSLDARLLSPHQSRSRRKSLAHLHFLPCSLKSHSDVSSFTSLASFTHGPQLVFYRLVSRDTENNFSRTSNSKKQHDQTLGKQRVHKHNFTRPEHVHCIVVGGGFEIDSNLFQWNPSVSRKGWNCVPQRNSCSWASCVWARSWLTKAPHISHRFAR